VNTLFGARKRGTCSAGTSGIDRRATVTHLAGQSELGFDLLAGAP